MDILRKSIDSSMKTLDSASKSLDCLMRTSPEQKSKKTPIFPCFFDAIFEARFAEAKNRKKRAKSTEDGFLEVDSAGLNPPGENKRGVKTSVLGRTELSY